MPLANCSTAMELLLPTSQKTLICSTLTAFIARKWEKFVDSTISSSMNSSIKSVDSTVSPIACFLIQITKIWWYTIMHLRVIKFIQHLMWSMWSILENQDGSCISTYTQFFASDFWRTLFFLKFAHLKTIKRFDFFVSNYDTSLDIILGLIFSGWLVSSYLSFLSGLTSHVTHGKYIDSIFTNFCLHSWYKIR